MQKTILEQILDEAVFQALVPKLINALGHTLFLAAVSILFGFLLGFLAALELRSKNKLISGIAGAYIWLFRCTPLLVQALYMYFVVPEILHVELSSDASGLIVLSLISGAYMANIIQDALGGIDAGQREAGLALGLGNIQTFFLVTFPQAFRNMIPALFNQFVICVKDTAVLSVISVNELTHVTKIYASLTYKNLASYTILAVFYWVIINILFAIQKIIEKTFGQGNKKQTTGSKTRRSFTKGFRLKKGLVSNE